MPGYHVVVGGKACAGGGSIIKSSIRPFRMASYQWPRPVQAMDLPMDGLSQMPGIDEQSYDGLLAELRNSGGPWWIGRVYRNYEHALDFYVRFSGDSGAIHHYELIMPPIISADDAADDDYPYPQPAEWYTATGKRWIARYTDAEYAAYVARYDAPAMDVAGTESIAAPSDAISTSAATGYDDNAALNP